MELPKPQPPRPEVAWALPPLIRITALTAHAVCGLTGAQWSLHPRFGEVQLPGTLVLQGPAVPRQFQGKCGTLEGGRHWSPGQDPHRCHPAASSGRFTVHLVSREAGEVLSQVIGEKQAQSGQQFVQSPNGCGLQLQASPPPHSFGLIRGKLEAGEGVEGNELEARGGLGNGVPASALLE